MKGTKTLIWIAVIAMIMTSCEDKNKWKKVDVSKITASVQTLRFEEDLYRIDTTKLAESESSLRSKYGSFYDDYVQGIMAFGAPSSKLDTVHHDYHIDLLHFLNNRSDRDLYDSVQLKYKDVSDIEAGITDAVKHFKYYFPDRRPVTKIYTFISEFANGAITYGDTVVGIGLDMYLGEQYPYYESVGFPVFMKKKLKRDYIVPNAVEVLYNLHFDKTAYNAELPLIEGLINEGRKYYFMECMMPDAPDSLLIGYTAGQDEWCRASEKSIWQYFNEHDLLYKVNFMDQKRYTTDGPTTAGMPAEAPAKVGSWIGWQIVRRFMKNSGGKVTLNDLLTKYSAKDIFAKANYKPK